MANKTLTGLVAGFGLLGSAYLLGCSELPEPKEGYQKATREQVQLIKKEYNGGRRQQIVARSDLVLRSMIAVEQLGLPEKEKKSLEKDIYSAWNVVYKADFDDDIKSVLEEIKKKSLDKTFLDYLKGKRNAIINHKAIFETNAEDFEKGEMRLSDCHYCYEAIDENNLKFNIKYDILDGNGDKKDTTYVDFKLRFDPKRVKWEFITLNVDSDSKRAVRSAIEKARADRLLNCLESRLSDCTETQEERDLLRKAIDWLREQNK